MKKPLHREVWCDLEGKTDRMAIVGTVAQAMRQRAVPESEVELFREEAHRSSTIDDLMNVCRKWVEVRE